jgi:hypothetical protein
VVVVAKSKSEIERKLRFSYSHGDYAVEVAFPTGRLGSFLVLVKELISSATARQTVLQTGQQRAHRTARRTACWMTRQKGHRRPTTTQFPPRKTAQGPKIGTAKTPAIW